MRLLRSVSLWPRRRAGLRRRRLEPGKASRRKMQNAGPDPQGMRQLNEVHAWDLGFVGGCVVPDHDRGISVNETRPDFLDGTRDFVGSLGERSALLRGACGFHLCQPLGAEPRHWW